MSDYFDEPMPYATKVTYGVSFNYSNLEEKIKTWKITDDHNDKYVAIEDLINDDIVNEMIVRQGVLEDFCIIDSARWWLKKRHIKLSKSQQLIVSFKMDIAIDYPCGEGPAPDNFEIDRSILGGLYDVEYEIIDRESN